MRTKQLLRKCSYSLLLVLFTLICALTFIVKPAKATAEEETAEPNVVNLFTPTETGENYTVSGFGKWITTTGVEDYADSPTGKVLRQQVNSNGITGGDFWPDLRINIPYEGDTTDFAGYIVWIEYDATMYTDSNFYGLFGTYINGTHVAGDREITFINQEGKIDETQTGRAYYHHNNYTAIPNNEVDGVIYKYAYTYSFKGYMVIPKETYTADVIPTADTYFKMSHHNAKNIIMDVKVGSIGFYKDYDAVLQEYGRCNYSFVDADGTVIETKSVQPGSTVVAPEYKNTFTQDGKVYEFVGWSNYTEGMKITSDKIFNASYKVRDFHTIEGASVRTNTGSSGIRFTAEFDENVYNEVSLDENLEFGMIITKYEYYKEAMEQSDDLMTGLKALQGTKYVLITESTKNPLRPIKYVEEGKVTYRINGALTNIKYSHMDWTWVGVGVIIKTTDNGTEYIYSAQDVEAGKRTIAYVASAALNNPKENFNQTQTDTLKNYVYTMAAKLSGVSEAEYKATTDKSAYLNDYKLEISGGIKADYDFNANDGTKEAYLNLNESKELFAAVKNESGATLDVAYSISVGDSSVLDVDGTTVTAIKNGYSSLTTSCAIFGINDTITVYTGSEDAGNRANSRNGSNANASSARPVTGEIDGQTYYWYQYSTAAGGSAHIYASYSDISVYYIDYLLSQGYKYLRIPFYFDTTRWAELGASSEEQVTAPYITTWIAGGYRGDSGYGFHYKNVPENQWCYYDMDLMHYRMNYVEADGSGVDTYGQKKTASSYYQYLNMKFCSAYSYVYVGNMTFIRESTVDIEEGTYDSIEFGDEISLKDYYSSAESLKFSVDGVEMDMMTAFKKQHTVEISANIFTANIGDGRYTIGDKNSWAVTYSTFDSIQKTISVDGGIDIADNSEILVDTKDAQTAQKSIVISDYTSADKLSELGFNVTQTYVKRYSDQTVNTSAEIANTERGIFYVAVSAENSAGQTLSYNVTLDLYNSSEPIEYESFGHADSSYAVKAYYAAQNSASEGLYNYFYSYEYISNHYVTGTKNSSGQDMFGIELTDEFATYFSLNKYGDDSKDTANKSTLMNGYNYTEADLANLTYIALDGSKIQLDGPLTNTDGTAFESYAMDACVYIYVLPRHTKTYYSLYTTDNASDLLRTVYAEPRTSGSVVAHFLTKVSGDVNNPTVGKTKKQNESANWQASLMTGNAQTITVETIATYYTAFENMSFPFIAWSRPAGRSASALSNNLFKLGMLIF